MKTSFPLFGSPAPASGATSEEHAARQTTKRTVFMSGNILSFFAGVALILSGP